ncbi:glycosyltransferase family 2 protein [Elizabethkingia anophelis]|uniref:Nucleoside-diphosphate-sugar pyrophosphorylase n=1 Tax=Elizabethkingia anophelis NUHP1 TaxID=1338011 RepID=A0A077ELN2_9FLAO|nr:glycosyltransferase family 2 protein [Elizabethkingia anophelis]AIL47099.1 Nucleoside-diphosphate-sugar pyrophosphorylase [Elizabethkingia anophelis NUHP1]MBE9392076.1 glycosyltransferase family 2 protein [Elizabethkingia anophelis]MBE9405516.1 glycosyltransferase family 2 protein [Elizabethkingia anophelis]MDV2446923.1 nucleotidyl transferase [Elizabethkingia anophelis]MDV3926648.1 nucleotidyl transferase [Elizabethkingia anophelis]
MLKILIPLAGSSELFEKAGYNYPKPLIEIKGKPMIQWVVESVNNIPTPFQFIFIIKESDVHKYHLDNTLKLLAPDSQIVKLKNETNGGLCSVLMAADLISENDSILILNSDQIINTNLEEVNHFWKSMDSDAGVITIQSVHPRWSYILKDGNEVIQTAEKNPISRDAIAGYYYFRSAELFFDYAYRTILNDTSVNGLFYISSVINEFILNNKKVNYYQIENNNYYSFYSPKLVQEFENMINGK